MKKKRGHVYVIMCHYTHFYKIGFSTNYKSRLKSLKTANPGIELVTVYSVDSIGVEALIHEAYKEKRVEGEWFDLTARDLHLMPSHLPF